ncbi:glycine cleavage system aminomethyltransferase GcvT [Actinoplanes siamensis]|uniref:Aminomethyltransferase n=1 Tax=Actinoplanes siamensis TaxID=1223317 RepID=A0A919N4Y3_9ACTN|nr:glycine cleavage system aminomethyltransferase GcvT [Actinoplanes siamensis]GIF04505.1 aminomethyltransferase [Actinoplanes siamensis]
MSADLLRSPLHDRHAALGAKFAPFGGWEMPLEYAGGGVLKEHAAVREAAGVFDVSHLGKARVLGPGAAEFVNSCLTNDLGRIAPGQAQYTLCCDESGGVVDDLIAYLYGPGDVFLVPNAANTAEVVRRLSAAAPDGVTVTDLHRDFAILAVQGPRSAAVLAALGLPDGHDYMSFAEARFGGAPLVVCRTGYTGEHGYELVVPWDAAGAVWDALIAAGVRPCGLGARDTLRTEMGYPLHGQELSLEISPVQARSGWAVGWSKPAFWGRAALTAEKAAGPRRTLRGLELTGRGIPRGHMPVFAGDTRVGEITSGTFSPTRKVGIALALIDTAPGLADGDLVEVDVRGRRIEARLVKPPFVRPSVR